MASAKAAILVEQWQPPSSKAASNPYRAPQQTLRPIAATAVVIAHVLAIWIMVQSDPESLKRGTGHRSDSAVFIAHFLEEDARALAEALRAPEPVLINPTIEIGLPTAIDFEGNHEELAPVAAIPFLPPQPDAAVVDTAPFAKKAGLAAGERLIVVLSVDVAADGHLTQVAVQKSAGSAADAAATEYAKALRWTPGSIGGRLQSMRTRLVVTLVG